VATSVVWLVVNAVNVLQAIGFATRPFAPGVNPVIGLVIATLAIPATWALQVFVRTHAGWSFIAGPILFDAFVVLMQFVDHALDIEWWDPVLPAIQVPYLRLFFGSILLVVGTNNACEVRDAGRRAGVGRGDLGTLAACGVPIDPSGRRSGREGQADGRAG
jgi:hypothetical protein